MLIRLSSALNDGAWRRQFYWRRLQEWLLTEKREYKSAKSQSTPFKKIKIRKRPLRKLERNPNSPLLYTCLPQKSKTKLSLGLTPQTSSEPSKQTRRRRPVWSQLEPIGVNTRSVWNVCHESTCSKHMFLCISPSFSTWPWLLPRGPPVGRLEVQPLLMFNVMHQLNDSSARASLWLSCWFHVPALVFLMTVVLHSSVSWIVCLQLSLWRTEGWRRRKGWMHVRLLRGHVAGCFQLGWCRVFCLDRTSRDLPAVFCSARM